jgi:serine/threonine protein kinase
VYRYFAPEVLKRRNTVRGAGRYGAAADMWSIGTVFTLYVLCIMRTVTYVCL